jgi:hypothetical protein
MPVTRQQYRRPEMARKTNPGHCSCGFGLMTETVRVMVRVMSEHRDEARDLAMCSKCAAATRENGLAVA